ncbi:chondroitin proteoglycan 2-like [Gigantopelta aegis]|uniref:chondroitin proteoglycan 2-like n=1 Tax=Gigantopelta aegis TaxID=1735272 RepID=UPI001B889103|nr:chondroitin proteoglycan 2-like [Gigantopelta aegis]
MGLMSSNSAQVAVSLLTVLFVIVPNISDGVSVFPNCVTNCTDVGLPGSYADCSTCYRFFICVGRRTLVMTCPGLLYYDHIVGVCSYYKSKYCGSSSSTEGSITREPVKNTLKQNETLSSANIPDDSSHVVQVSPSLTLLELGDRPTPIGCIYNCSDVTLSGRYSDCTSCSHMIVCIGQRMTKVRCPPPLHYDPSLGVCNYHWKVNCRRKPSPGSDVVVSKHAVRSNDRCIDDCAEVKIPGKYASCQSCSTFILCTGQKTFVLTCPKTLHFDLVNKRCTFASSVDCREEAVGDFATGDVASGSAMATPNKSVESSLDSISDPSTITDVLEGFDGAIRRQMGNLLNFAQDDSQESEMERQKLDVLSKTGDQETRRGLLAADSTDTSLVHLGDAKSSSFQLAVKTADELTSLKKFFCQTFNADLDLHLSLCEN